MTEIKTFHIRSILYYMTTFTLTLLLIHSAGASPAGPSIITVDDDGGKDYISIQYAIGNASDGDIIQVYPGTYNENVNLTKQLTLTSVNGASVTYIVAASANDNAIYLNHDNITIDGFTISGANIQSHGIYTYSNNNTISNNIISGNYNGVTLRIFKNNRMINNTISNNSYRGIGLFFSTGNSIINNTCKDNSYENINLYHSDGNTLINNTLTASQLGITIESSRDNIFRNNSIITLYGISLDNSPNDIDTSNTINGKSIYYLKNQRNISIGAAADPGMIHCLNCTNITVKDLNLTGNVYAIHFCNTTYSTIENNSLIRNSYGINLFDSNHNRIVNNRLYLNRYSFYFDGARENLIYNNSLNSTKDSRFFNNCTGNIWNTTKTAGQNIAGGSYLGGNYWLKLDGTGFSQINNTDLNGDGICDEAYTIYPGQIDHLPLVPSYMIPPASITALSGSRKGITWINWTWTNPTDTDFNHTMIYLNGTFKENTTGTYYNATGLDEYTDYIIQTRTVDRVGNINTTWVNKTTRTYKTPPNSITDLSEAANASTWINWTWINPTDTYFNHTMVYLNGTFKANVTDSFYNATGLNDNTVYVLQTRTSGTFGNINSTWINDTASTLNTLPPASITGLSEATNASTWINWTWTNPIDTDFNHTMVYLNGTFKANVTDSFYNATGLTDNTNYMLQTKTVDIAGNINSTWINDTASTLNTLPPASITGLSESANGSTWINWTWTSPADIDFNYTMVYLNGTFKANVTDSFYNATGLTDNTNYMLQTRTVDTAGNINATWINDTARTLNTLPPANVTGLSEATNGSTWINWTWTNPTDTDFNYTMVYLNGTFKANVTDSFYNATGLTDNTNYMLQTKTVDTAGNINSTWVNDSASTLNTLPPSSITGLSESTNGSTWINWTWTNPTDTDFNYTMVYLNGTFKVNVTGTYYNATGLTDNTNYMLQTRTVDTAGNINATWINDTASTLNTLPPANITGLSESTNGSTWINWTWTNPTDTDFNYTMVYLNGTFKENITGTYYNATGLTDNTNYMLQTKTVDTAGNINSTWINDTASTLNTLPPSSITGLSESANASTWINWTWTNPTDTDFNYTMVYLNDTFKANVTGTYYNATGLTDNTNYMLQTRTVDIAGNINSTWVNDTASTMNTLPPASVTGLSESTNGSTWINWTWTNPTDTDFNYTMVYLNGTFKANITGTAYNATGLTDNTNYMLQTKTVDTADNINSTWINDTASTLNTLPPSSITGLSESANGSTWINWTWTNPTDTDFNYTMVYLNDTFKSNVTGTYYNATGLSDNTNYILQTKTVDIAGNINSTWINDTASTLNTLPPASITNLSSSTGSSWINWAWTNPADRDHNYSMVYLNGVFRINVSGDSYSATNLQSSRNYEISIRTVDTAGNINTTWINDTATTTAESSGSRSSVGQSMPPQEVASTDTGVKKVLAGADVNFDLSSGEGPVLGISFKANSNEGNVVATVQVLNERPAGVTGEPTGRRYQTMSITVGREGTISKDNADDLTIRFKVSKEWIRQNGIDPATIRMTRYHDGTWNDLPTDSVDEDDEYYYFSALTPGFSVFEVVGDEATQQTGQTSEVDTQPATSPEQQTTQQTVPEEEEEESGLPGFTVVWGTIMLSLAAVGRRYRK